MKNIEIFDNFIPENNQMIVGGVLRDLYFPWYYNTTTIKYTENSLDFNKKYLKWWQRKFPINNNKPQFTHTFYKNGEIKSNYFEIIKNSFFDYIPEFQTHNLDRIKANLTYPYRDRSILMPHRDLDGKDGVIYLYYVEDSDGPTIVFDENGKMQKIHPKQGRVLKMSALTYHSSNVPNKYEKRVVINIVFSKK